jgi:Outer membrane protein beta-barrel domain
MRRLILLASILVCPVAFGEHLLSFGVKGGFPLTDPLGDAALNGIDTITRVFSNSKNYVIGPMVELNLPFGLSVEADALYRPLNLTTETQVLPMTTVTRSSVDFHSMEFPILLKAHFLHTPVVKPYVEAGPVFRYVASKVPYLSNSGFALGAGLDFKLLLVRIGPELRFSRWGHDSTSPLRNISLPPSNQNQVEFLIGLSF